ncbi:putative cell cycle checkpoint control protein RAD9A [Monocercomonoides exilis]|uniref:putative cell cycle checkpoint control protein RAD9A n=1 Tax=Monocercomonoides exilis TaxID=2049356 RepID=UPI003559B957|nr:putative cell cycle checkpoint control protein RAD9A [Monocercomonoides exilis]|eukprot:MONOS_12704.1-p1 / transcript=MONOS_12704.1 / gene=MONOS_12704 / organism=Monocercomonoides_exilis_PA203 / gene_product=unspecified product / transcript_product=unspecified product / location=Mono_scaffold00721:24892-26380(-) / protein_length=344 / sequence_SO=supercontig / SO=protein_coding / is_pseudo=false
MEAQIPSQNLRIFLRAITCCAKIGDELYLRGRPDGLNISIVNSTRSVFFSFAFHSLFFDNYTVIDENATRCKIQLRQFLSALKVFKPFDVSNESKYILRITTEPPRVVVQYTSSDGIVRAKSLTFESSRAVHAATAQNTPGKIQCSPAVFDHPSLAKVTEVELQFRADSIKMLNFVESQPGTEKRMKTAITIRVAPPHFSQYEIPSMDRIEEEGEKEGRMESDESKSDRMKERGDEENDVMTTPSKRTTFEGGSALPSFTSISSFSASSASNASALTSSYSKPFSLIFCVKEFRALLHFTSGIGSPITLSFSQPGKPLCISLNIDRYLQANFVLATLLVRSDIE